MCVNTKQNVTKIELNFKVTTLPSCAIYTFEKREKKTNLVGNNNCSVVKTYIKMNRILNYHFVTIFCWQLAEYIAIFMALLKEERERKKNESKNNDILS